MGEQVTVLVNCAPLHRHASINSRVARKRCGSFLTGFRASETAQAASKRSGTASRRTRPGAFPPLSTFTLYNLSRAGEGEHGRLSRKRGTGRPSLNPVRGRARGYEHERLGSGKF